MPYLKPLETPQCDRCKKRPARLELRAGQSRKLLGRYCDTCGPHALRGKTGKSVRKVS